MKQSTKHEISGTYILIDPFNRPDSGVTTYTRLASSQLARAGIATTVISIHHSESIVEFRARVQRELCNSKLTIICIEAPESLASTSEIPANLPLHIRLHCSRSLGAAVQGQPYRAEEVALEQAEITRAHYLSAPSWAAYFASESLFQFSKPPFFYPNPAPQELAEHANLPQKQVFDVIFVGRLQNLKGLRYLEKAASKLKHLKFAVACPSTQKDNLKHLPNITFFDGETLSKPEIYSLSRTVLIPSIFETSSMVAIEALSHECRVILWEHLGAAEYFDHCETINRVKMFHTRSLIRSIQKESRKKGNPTNQGRSVATELNEKFIIGTLALMRNDITQANMLIKPSARIEHNTRHLVSNQKKKMAKKKKHPFIRKTIKLFLHPIAFFRDSSEAKYIKKKLFERRLRNFLTLQKEFASANPTPNTTELAANLGLNAVALQNDSTSHFSDIQEVDKIQFRNIETKPAGYSTALIFDQNISSKTVENLQDKLDLFEDFKYLNRERLQTATFSIPPETSSLSIINRIDVKNKVNLSKLNFIFLLDAPDSLCEALRSSGTEQVIILINTKTASNIRPDSVDAVISVTSDLYDKNKIKRLIIIDSVDDIALAMRRVLQEGFPRKRDMLLSLHSDGQCPFTDEDFENFDYAAYQGTLKIRKSNYTDCRTMSEIYKRTSEATIGVALLESVYMKYRSLCEQVEAGLSPEALIEACLKDGILLDVQEA